MAASVGQVVHTRGLARRLRFVFESRVLAKAMLALLQSDEDALAEAFAADAGVSAGDDLYGRLLAALLVSGNPAALRRWLERGAKDDLSETALAVVDFARDNFPPRSTRGARKLMPS